MIRLRAREDLAQHVGDVALGRDEARDLGVRGVGEEEVDALLAEPGERVQVGEAVVQRELVHLEVARVHYHARGVRMATASASGMEWLTATNSQSKGPMRSRCPSATWRVYGRMRCSWSLASIRARVSLEPISGMSGFSRRRKDAADVVLVTVGEDDALDVVETVPDGREVGQNQVDSGLLLLGEEHSAVDDQQAASVLEDRHVAADLAETTERGDPQATFGERRGGPSSGCG